LKEETYGWNLEMVMRVAAAVCPHRRSPSSSGGGSVARHPHRWRQSGLVNIDDVCSPRLEL
jgi:hypothetical protein